MGEKLRISKILKDMHSLMGMRCIFREKGTVQVVRLSGIHLVQDGYLEFDLVPLGVKGFLATLTAPFSIGCDVEYLTIEETYYFAPYVNWFLIIDTKVVNKIIRMVAATPRGTNPWGEIMKMIDGPESLRSRKPKAESGNRN